MRRIIDYICLILLGVAIACSNSEVYDNMPYGIQKFLAEYYPDMSIESFSTPNDTYKVVVKDGPTIIFNNKMSWISVDGNGSTLPQVLLFNDFPPELYAYLQETQNEHGVFSVARNSSFYQVQLLDSEIFYDIATNKITGDESSAQ